MVSVAISNATSRMDTSRSGLPGSPWSVMEEAREETGKGDLGEIGAIEDADGRDLSRSRRLWLLPVRELMDSGGVLDLDMVWFRSCRKCFRRLACVLYWYCG